MDKQRPAALAALMRSAAATTLVMRVDGRSMGTTIVAGSEVVVHARQRPPRTSEVWAFCNDEGTVVVHRYRRRAPDGRFVFRGDGQPYYDPPVPAEQLIGRVSVARTGAGDRRFGNLERGRFLARRVVGRLRGSLI